MYYTPYLQPRRGALVGDEVYFTLRWGNAIVKYNWGNNCLSVINPPSPDAYHVTLMLMEDSSLGFACIEGSSLCLWSRKVNSEGAAEWVQCRVIELKTMIPVADPDDEAIVVGSAEGVGVVFVSTGAGLFAIELNSGQVKKVDEPEVYFSVLPYMSFYTSDCGTSSSLARLRTHCSLMCRSTERCFQMDESIIFSLLLSASCRATTICGFFSVEQFKVGMRKSSSSNVVVLSNSWGNCNMSGILPSLFG